MTPPPYLLAIDQGTTSTRAVVFDARARPLGSARRELTQHYPASGRVEHDAEDIWRDTLATAREALQQSALSAGSIAALGITNQRETTLIWERATGKPIHRAIVWQDRRTAAECAALKAAGAEALVRQRTGLVLDPYFSGTKIAWLLDNVPGARARAARGELAFGTIDTFLLWRLTNGRLHATDATNASRTLLFNLHTQDWDQELLRLLRVPRELLPEVRDSSGDFGTSTATLLGAEIPIRGVAGDQQAALVGQGCFERGMAKSTYGTGCFLLLNTGEVAVRSTHMLTTVAYRLGGRTTYAMEGSIFVAGAAVKWLRDGLHVLRETAESAAAAASVPDDHGVYLVPAFVGLGAPHWDPHASGTLIGLGRGTKPGHIARAALEAIAFQVADVLDAVESETGTPLGALRVDGGAAVNDLLMQFQADVLGVPVVRPQVTETTALGAAYLAGLATGFWASPEELRAKRHGDERFAPRMEARERKERRALWEKAVERSKRWNA
jgi:glycerol kinase